MDVEIRLVQLVMDEIRRGLRVEVITYDVLIDAIEKGAAIGTLERLVEHVDEQIAVADLADVAHVAARDQPRFAGVGQLGTRLARPHVAEGKLVGWHHYGARESQEGERHGGHAKGKKETQKRTSGFGPELRDTPGQSSRRIDGWVQTKCAETPPWTQPQMQTCTAYRSSSI